MITVNGEAKINLTLDILGKRPDGYHEVSMVMQSVSLHDTLQLERIPEGIELSIDVPWLEADETNLAYRAAAKILRMAGCRAVSGSSCKNASRWQPDWQAAVPMQQLSCVVSTNSTDSIFPLMNFAPLLRSWLGYPVLPVWWYHACHGTR